MPYIEIFSISCDYELWTIFTDTAYETLECLPDAINIASVVIGRPNRILTVSVFFNSTGFHLYMLLYINNYFGARWKTWLMLVQSLKQKNRLFACILSMQMRNYRNI